MRRWTPDMPEEVFQRFYQYMSAIFGVISLDEAGVAPVFHHIQEVISVSAMYQRLHTVEDTWLLAKYEEASQTLPAMGALGLAVVNMLLPAFAEWARRHNKPHASFPIGVDTENLLAGIQQEGNRVLVARENPMGELRLIFTLGLAIFPVEEEEILPQWARVLGELFSGLARYLNIPAKQAAMLDLPG